MTEEEKHLDDLTIELTEYFMSAQDKFREKYKVDSTNIKYYCRAEVSAVADLMAVNMRHMLDYEIKTILALFSARVLLIATELKEEDKKNVRKFN